jgi:hypothetical protein
MPDVVGLVQDAINGSGTVEDVQRCIDGGAPVNEFKDGASPLLVAVKARHTELVCMLLQAKADANAEDSRGVTTLHTAVFDGSREIVENLLAARADVDKRDRHGQTPLFFAPHRSACIQLGEARADINVVNFKGQSALHLAAHAGLNDSVRWLAMNSKPGIVNHQDKHGRTPAYCAARSNLRSTIRLLQDNGADVLIQPYKMPKNAATMKVLQDAAGTYEHHRRKEEKEKEKEQDREAHRLKRKEELDKRRYSQEEEERRRKLEKGRQNLFEESEYAEERARQMQEQDAEWNQIREQEIQKELEDRARAETEQEERQRLIQLREEIDASKKAAEEMRRQEAEEQRRVEQRRVEEEKKAKEAEEDERRRKEEMAAENRLLEEALLEHDAEALLSQRLDEEEATIDAAFDRIDINHDGFITFDEFEAVEIADGTKAATVAEAQSNTCADSDQLQTPVQQPLGQEGGATSGNLEKTLEEDKLRKRVQQALLDGTTFGKLEKVLKQLTQPGCTEQLRKQAQQALLEATTSGALAQTFGDLSQPVAVENLQSIPPASSSSLYEQLQEVPSKKVGETCSTLPQVSQPVLSDACAVLPFSRYYSAFFKSVPLSSFSKLHQQFQNKPSEEVQKAVDREPQPLPSESSQVHKLSSEKMTNQWSSYQSHYQ